MYGKLVKPIFDIVAALLFVVLFAWLYILLGILVRTKLGSPVIFKQARPGKINPKTGEEEIFNLYKFRTMTDERDDQGNLLEDAKRLTKFGSFLRKTSLDEIPEILFNVLIFRNMSWIGPRPLLVSYLPWYSDRERTRHSVKPGITGLAQVNGRNFLAWDDRLEMDAKYVENLSLAMDCRIIFQTVAKIFMRQDIAVDTRAVETNFAVERSERMNIENNE